MPRKTGAIHQMDPLSIMSENKRHKDPPRNPLCFSMYSQINTRNSAKCREKWMPSKQK
jgi:hypothetical protein